MKLIYTAKCAETAHVVTDWPWGWTLKTEARFWIETTKHGDRFVQQTLNPKTGKWCKPKKQTYEAVLVLAITDQGKVTNVGIGKHADRDRIAAALETIDFEKLEPAQKKQVCKLNAWAEVMENVEFTIAPRIADPVKRAEHEAEQARIGGKIAGAANHLAQQCMFKNGLI